MNKKHKLLHRDNEYITSKLEIMYEEDIQRIVEERNIYKNIVNELKELLSNPYNQDCVVQNNDFLNKIFELEKK